MKTLCTGTALLLSIVFCLSKPPVGYTITGNVTGFPENTMLYLRNLSVDDNIDSTLVVNGKFAFQGRLAETPEHFWLHTTVDEKFIYTYLFIGNEDVKIEGDIADFPHYLKKTGSKTQDEHNELYDLINEYNIAREALYDDYMKSSNEMREEKGKEFWAGINRLDSIRKTIEIEYIKSHLDTYYGVVYLGYMKAEIPKDTLRTMYDQIPDEIKKSKYGRIVELYLNTNVSEVGDMCQDFEAFDTDGNTVRFHDLLDGKYILLDMTQANCGPCMQSINELKMINIRYSDSLRVVSFYTDTNKKIWLESLERDKATWLTLWDGKGMSGETPVKYGLSGTPTFYLIDPQGKIIDIQVGYSQGIVVNQLGRNNIPRNAPKP